MQAGAEGYRGSAYIMIRTVSNAVGIYMLQMPRHEANG